ncbi:MAG: HAD-IIIC family phosphatase [Bacteroidota bacterium]
MTNTYSFRALKKNLKKDHGSLPQLKLSLLGDAATQLLGQAIRGYGYERKIDIQLYEGDYDQIDLQVNDPNSDFYEHKSDYVCIHKTSYKLRAKFGKTPLEKKADFAKHCIFQFKHYIESINARSSSRIIISNFPEIKDRVFGNYGNKVQLSWTYQLRKLNFELMVLAQEYDNVFINDVASLQHLKGQNFAHDTKTYINASMPESLDFVPLLARNMVDIVLSIYGRFKKCLILDLDNTTWGGIIGDDGLEGIQVGDLGIGKAFNELQQWAKQLKDRGIILAICSKNTESVAKEPFEKHPEMVLRLDDISVFVANWENKADNIRFIQQVLNIGFDSMVFLDDNPFERNLVRSELPDVTVPELPEDPAQYLSFVEELNLFETSSFSSEDSGRTKKYQEEADRAKLKQSFGSIADYLQSLQMKGSFVDFDSFHVPRLAQLSQRSNQFNLRTVRYDEQQIKDIIASEERLGYYVKLEDKFGEYGLISFLILDVQEDALFIDTWIMSCRVLKRDVEKYVLNKVVEKAQELGKSKIIGEYLPTPKNALVKEHYKDLGFEAQSDRWVLDITTYESKAHFIQ